jgi:hypothetical protein
MNGARCFAAPHKRHLLLVAGLFVCAWSCKGSASKRGTAETERPFPENPRVAERAYDAKDGLGKGWSDYGWAPRTFGPSQPAKLDLTTSGGWILAHEELQAGYEGLLLRLRAPAAGWEEFLEVRLDSSRPNVYPRIRLKDAAHKPAEGGSHDYFIAMSTLDPQGLPFEQIVLRAVKPLAGKLEIELVALTASGAQVPAGAAAREGRLVLDCLAQGHDINPMIYGVAYNFLKVDDPAPFEMGAAARRWGGNAATRFNPNIGHAWNTANDWYFRNVNYTGRDSFSPDDFFEEDLRHGVRTALTIPTLGWVAKDTRSSSFPASRFPRQQSFAPEDGAAGNGLAPDGKPLPAPPPSQTSVRFLPKDASAWVKRIRERDQNRSGRSVDMYILDNEPTLWGSTHRDVHPSPVSYDELLEKIVDYGSAVREADPDAVIAAPAEWGWTGLLYSEVDMKAGGRDKPDRMAHGNLPLAAWLLSKIHEHEQKTGKRLLDVFDVHFYPAGNGIGMGASGSTDAGTSARRIRAVRALWDPKYRDESWIGEPVQLIPQLKAWIDKYDPGVGISIGEYNFGAENHVSGGLALAEALGRFGSLGITSAFYWTYPPPGSPAYWAFRAYRNYDGKGARFGDVSVQAQSFDAGASLFASRDRGGKRFTAVLLNFEPQPLNARIDVSTCRALSITRVFSYTGTGPGLEEAKASHEEISRVLPLQVAGSSITVLELQAK